MRCLMCGRKFHQDGSLYEILWSDDLLCEQCRSGWKKNHRQRKIQGIPVRSLWEYNEAFSSCLIQFKECGDEALKDVFFHPVRHKLRLQFHGWTLLLMPSSASKMAMRGFSHLEEMYGSLGVRMLSPFLKLSEEDQKKQTRTGRQEMRHAIVLKENVRLPEKIILADDVITTGSTLAGALACLDRRKHHIRMFTAASVPLKRPETGL